MERFALIGMLLSAALLAAPNFANCQGTTKTEKPIKLPTVESGLAGPAETSLFGLLQYPQIQVELNLSPAEVESARVLRQKASVAFERRIDKSDRLSPVERAARADEFLAVVEGELAATIGAAKLKRLKQLQLQLVGVRGALKLRGVADVLQLSKEQRRKLHNLDQAMLAQTTTSRDELKAADADSRRKIWAEMRRRLDEQVLALFTDEQRTKISVLWGKPVYLKLPGHPVRLRLSIDAPADKQAKPAIKVERKSP